MRTYQLSGAGFENLREIEVPAPQALGSSVVVRMRAATLNARDLGVASGKLPNVRYPLVPLSDGVGEVVEIGAEVTRFKLGDRVCPMFYPRWSGGEANPDALSRALGGTVDGTARELLMLDEQAFALAPAHLSDVEAASLCCAGLTAWSALQLAGVRAGDSVVVQGTGGVAIYALQFAQLLGCQVIVTSSSDEKLEAVAALGATQRINYRAQPEWAQAVREFTNGRGARAVIDIGGGATIAQSAKAVGFGGTVCVIGVLGGIEAALPIRELMMKCAGVRGLTVGSRQGFEAMAAAVAQHRLRPVIDRVYPRSELPAAYARLASAAHIGKVGVELYA